jgi:hypothetical protein
MNTKSKTISYWVSTGLLSLMMLFAGYSYLMAPESVEGFRKIGFPDFFRIELAIAKIIGVAALLLPIPQRIKEWAYAGFGITFISAFITHLSVGDPIGKAFAPVVAFAILAASYLTRETI